MKQKVIVFTKRNWLPILLGIALILMAVLYFSNRVKDESEVVIAPAPSDMLYQTPGQAAAVPSGSITFCFRLDGREDQHLPALMGAQGSNIYPNGLSGYNWSLSPTATGAEPYGILPDGTVFAKISFLQQWGMSGFVEIKSDQTGWAAKKMEQSVINGEQAYIFSPF